MVGYGRDGGVKLDVGQGKPGLGFPRACLEGRVTLKALWTFSKLQKDYE